MSGMLVGVVGVLLVAAFCCGGAEVSGGGCSAIDAAAVELSRIALQNVIDLIANLWRCRSVNSIHFLYSPRLMRNRSTTSGWWSTVLTRAAAETHTSHTPRPGQRYSPGGQVGKLSITNVCILYECPFNFAGQSGQQQ